MSGVVGMLVCEGSAFVWVVAVRLLTATAEFSASLGVWTGVGRVGCAPCLGCGRASLGRWSGDMTTLRLSSRPTLVTDSSLLSRMVCVIDL